MEGTGWVRGLRYLIEGFPYATARGDGGCYDRVAILSRGDHWHTSKGRVAHGEEGQLCVLFGAIRTLARSLSALIGASEHTHIRIRPFLLAFHNWLLQALGGWNGIGRGARHTQIKVKKLLAWVTSDVRIDQLQIWEVVPGQVDVRNTYACTSGRWQNLE